MDILLCETGNGGDFLFASNDFKITEGFSNQIYLGWFGGNVGADERDREDTPQSEQRTDWLGNELCFAQDLGFYFNSELETLLQESALSSSQRILIEQIAKEDLVFLGDFGSVSVSAEIQDLDRIKLNAKITEPNNQESKIFSYIWDAEKNEASCLCDGYIKFVTPPLGDNYSPFDYNNEYEN